MDDIIRAVADNMPKFNYHALVEFPRKQVNDSVEYFSNILREACLLLGSNATYKGYRILSPQERAQEEIEKKRTTVAVSELQLVEFQIIHHEHRPDGTVVDNLHKTKLYMPYLVNDMLVLNGKQWALQKGITEQVFSRMDDGMMVRVPRAVLRFSRNKMMDLMNSTTGEVISREHLVHAGLHLKDRRKNAKLTTPIHYLICRFGFQNAMAQFGLQPGDLTFTDQVLPDGDEYEYLSVSKMHRRQDIHMKVRKSLLADRTIREVIANAIYPIYEEIAYSLEDLIDPESKYWIILLGRFIQDKKDLPDPQAISQASSHLASTDLFLDPGSQKRLRTFGVHVNDIYDLLRLAFVQLGETMVNTTHQDLYTKRLDIRDGLFLREMVHAIMRKFYASEIRPRMNRRDIQNVFRFPTNLVSNLPRSRLTMAPSIFGDNMLMSVLWYKVRLNTSATSRVPNPYAAEVRFHHSVPVVESHAHFSGSNPSITGLINPFVPISEEGGIVIPDYAEDLEELKAILPYQ